MIRALITWLRERPTRKRLAQIMRQTHGQSTHPAAIDRRLRSFLASQAAQRKEDRERRIALHAAEWLKR